MLSAAIACVPAVVVIAIQGENPFAQACTDTCSLWSRRYRMMHCDFSPIEGVLAFNVSCLYSRMQRLWAFIGNYVYWRLRAFIGNHSTTPSQRQRRSYFVVKPQIIGAGLRNLILFELKKSSGDQTETGLNVTLLNCQSSVYIFLPPWVYQVLFLGFILHAGNTPYIEYNRY